MEISDFYLKSFIPSHYFHSRNFNFIEFKNLQALESLCQDFAINFLYY